MKLQFEITYQELDKWNSYLINDTHAIGEFFRYIRIWERERNKTE